MTVGLVNARGDVVDALKVAWHMLWVVAALDSLDPYSLCD